MLTTTEAEDLADSAGDPTAFDAEWYERAFPDVAMTGMAPWEHFQKYGRGLGRAPNGALAELAQPPELSRPMAVETLVSLWSGAVELGRFRAETDLAARMAPVAAYAALLGLERQVFEVTGAEASDCLKATPELGVGLLQEGPVQLQALWFADAARLRLSLTGAEQALHLRLYQAPPEAPEGLAPVGGAEIQGEGPHFVDAPLFNPLMPVLIELAGADGLTEGFALLPFPSLARGGLHGAERAAWAKGRDPLADLWRLSQAYLTEMLGRGSYAIGAVEAEALAGPVGDALAAIFGLGSDDRSGPLELVLGPGMVPTLAALVSRRLALPRGTPEAAGPFLVAEETGNRPLWSVALPAGAAVVPGQDLPLLRRIKGRRSSKAGVPENWLAPLHLAIALRPPEPVTEILTFLPADSPPPDSGLAVTAVLRTGDVALAGRALAALSLQEGVEIAGLLLQTAPEAPAPDEILAVAEGLFPGQVTEVPLEAGLDALAEAATGEALLLLDEAVLTYDPATLAGLAALLESDDTVASVAPALLHEAEFKKGTRVQLASAGLFPMGLDFTAGPRLSIGAPDVLEALPGHAYPVIGNSFALCLIRVAAIAATAEARQGYWGDAPADVKFGLDAQAAGWRSLATTQIRAGTTDAPQARDEIDPMGLACLLPDQWAALVAQVTLVRELRG